MRLEKDTMGVKLEIDAIVGKASVAQACNALAHDLNARQELGERETERERER